MSDDTPKPEIFRAAYADIPIRDQRDTMERPFFSLAKKPRKAPIEYSVSGVTVQLDSVVQRLAWAAIHAVPQPYRAVTADA